MGPDIRIEDFKDVSMSDIKKEEESQQWRCCMCGTTDSRLLRFVAVYLIILIVFMFCLLMLSRATNCEETTTYISLLTMLLGVVLPSPH